MNNYFGTSYDQILQDEENSSMINTHCPQNNETPDEDCEEPVKFRNSALKNNLEHFEDDLESYVSDTDAVYLIHINHNYHPIYLHVLRENIPSVLDEYDDDDLVDIKFYSKGKDFKKEMEELF